MLRHPSGVTFLFDGFREACNPSRAAPYDIVWELKATDSQYGLRSTEAVETDLEVVDGIVYVLPLDGTTRYPIATWVEGVTELPSTADLGLVPGYAGGEELGAFLLWLLNIPPRRRQSVMRIACKDQGAYLSVTVAFNGDEGSIAVINASLADCEEA